ncbi:MAG: hypothetical protein ACR2PY_07015 [Salinispira sp.]
MIKIHVKISLLLAVFAVLLLSACMSAQSTETGPSQLVDIPEFFLNPPVLEDQFVGLGLAKLSDATLSRRTALTRARADIALQVSAAVETMLVDYVREGGADGDSQLVAFVEQVTKEVSDIELRGAITQEQYPAQDGTWYVMVHFPKDALLNEVGSVFERNENAAFAEFKAQQALERLEADVENNPPRSEGVDSPANQ